MNRTLLHTLLPIAIAFGIIFACTDPPTFPTPPPSSTTTTSPEQPPRVDIDFSWDTYQGIIAFGLGHPGQSEQDVLAFVNAALSKGRNTFEVCSELEFWDGSFQYPQKPRDVERLRWTLDLLAHVPGAQVALIGNCTLKRQVPLAEQFNWAVDVACVVSGGRVAGVRTCEPNVQPRYRNVAIFTHNEFDNCRSRSDWGGRPEYCAGKQDVADHIRLYREYGIRWVTADDSYRPPKPGDPAALTYGFRLANIGASPASFHPDRTKDGHPWDPSLHQLQQLARHNGLFVLSETVAFADSSGDCSGLRTCDVSRIERYVDVCAAVPECRFTYHCDNCLNGEVPTYIPEAR